MCNTHGIRPSQASVPQASAPLLYVTCQGIVEAIAAELIQYLEAAAPLPICEAEAMWPNCLHALHV